MKIIKAEREYLEFDNGTNISSDYSPDCCEYNYADFSAIDDLAKEIKFDKELKFETSEGGFRFGNNPANMVYVPCYSSQNGYYSTDVVIYLNDWPVLDVECELID